MIKKSQYLKKTLTKLGRTENRSE